MQILNNNRGFSLLELLVVVGLLGGISLIVMNLSKETNKISTKFQFDTEIVLITNEINGLLSDPNKCLTTFTNATQLALPSQPILSATPVNILSPTGIASVPSSDRKYNISGGPYGNGGVNIVSYSLNLAVTPDPVLTIKFLKKKIIGGGNTSKIIKLNVTKNALGVITSCKSIANSSVDIWSHGLGTDIFYTDKVGIGNIDPSTGLSDKLVVNGGSIISNAQSSSGSCIDFSTGNVQVSSTTSTAIKLGGLSDGGAYSLILTGNYGTGSTITLTGYKNPTCSIPISGGVDFGGSSTAYINTFEPEGNTQVLTFIYSAARGGVYVSPSTNYFH